MSADKITFQDFKLNKQLLTALDELGFTVPTPIQKKLIPLAMAGHDVLGIAPTGTGKTAAFLVPILMKLKYAQDQGPRALILSPTRELAMQIEAHARALSSHLDLRFVVLFGGIGPTNQINQIKEGVDLIIASPGRFLDIYSKGHITVKNINTMVLDEADRMMDMGFIPQVNRILEIIPQKKQNMLFSATMPEKMELLAGDFLKFPQRVEVSPQSTTAETIAQSVYHVPGLKTKIKLLETLFEDETTFSKVIIFCRTKESANNVYKYLERKEIGPVKVIHANKGQNSRINAIREFTEGDLRILVSTDISSRGIDISEVSHVINFELPLQYEDYVHRVGRTGRALKSGEAISLANPAEQVHLLEIEKLIRKKITVVPLPEVVENIPPEREERIQIEREIDHYRRSKDPDFKGAFHKKNQKPTHAKKKSKFRNR